MIHGVSHFNEECGRFLLSVDRWERPRYDAAIEHLRSDLGDSEFDAVWETGTALSFDELLSETMADPKPPVPTRPVRLEATRVQLTARTFYAFQCF